MVGVGEKDLEISFFLFGSVVSTVHENTVSPTQIACMPLDSSDLGLEKQRPNPKPMF